MCCTHSPKVKGLYLNCHGQRQQTKLYCNSRMFVYLFWVVKQRIRENKIIMHIFAKQPTTHWAIKTLSSKLKRRRRRHLSDENS